ncbi:hypothetical protein ACJ8ML_09540 [Bifidobacterium longum subsp. longum]
MTSHIEEPPLRDKLTLTVPEAGALSGIPARVVRAAVLSKSPKSILSSMR